jgi:putative sterol carrier protein
MKTRRSQFYVTMTILAVALTVPLALAASAEKESVVPQDVFDGMRENFHPEKARGVHVRYLFELSGPNGGDWWIDVTDGTCKMGKGKIENPNVTYVASDKDWVALSNGKLGGKWAFFTGRLKIRGDRGLARKMDEIFN